MVSLSDKAIDVISDLEYQKKYYFTKDDIREHFVNDKQLYNFIYNQRKNGRVIKLNKDKYFLIPIKARKRKWTDHPLIVADEIMNKDDYFVGGWYAAHYWGLTDQIPTQMDIFSPKKYGKMNVMNKRYVFHRIKPISLKKKCKQKIGKHSFFILKKSETEKWISSK